MPLYYYKLFQETETVLPSIGYIFILRILLQFPFLSSIYIVIVAPGEGNALDHIQWPLFEYCRRDYNTEDAEGAR